MKRCALMNEPSDAWIAAADALAPAMIMATGTLHHVGADIGQLAKTRRCRREIASRADKTAPSCQAGM